jgi:hypothetical protein
MKKARKMSQVVCVEGVEAGREGELWGIDIAEEAVEIVADGMGKGLVERCQFFVLSCQLGDVVVEARRRR